MQISLKQSIGYNCELQKLNVKTPNPYYSQKKKKILTTTNKC